MTSFPALSRSTKHEAIVTSRTIKGNSEKKALKANAAAQCDPSIHKNLLTARRSIRQTRRVSRPSRFGKPDTLKAAALIDLPGGAGLGWVQGDCMNSVGRTPSRWRSARYWVLIISLTLVGLETPTRSTSGVVSSAASTVMVP